MFGTLRLNSEPNTNEFIEHAKGEEASYLGGYVFSHSACYNCRSKKLRCSGQKSGCDRCKARSFKCTYTQSVEARRPRQRQQTEKAGPVDIPYDPIPTGVLKDGVTSAGAEDSRKRSRHKPGQYQHEISNKRNSEAESDQNHNIDKNNFAQSLELGDFVSPGDASKEVLNNISHSQSPKSDDMIVGQLMDHDFMDDEYIAGLLDLDDHGSFSGARQFPSSTISKPFSIRDNRSDTTDPSSGSPCSSMSCDLTTKKNSKTFSSPLRLESSGSLIEGPGWPSRGTDAQSDSSCHCLHSMLRLLDEIETKTMAINATTVDEILAYHRHAVGNGNDVLSCRSCCSRSEYVTLLAIISDKLATLSDKIVAAFICHLQEQDELGNQNVVDMSGDWRSGKKGMRLGGYEVRTQKEWACLITAVITLQLKELVAHIRKVRVVATSTRRDIQVQGLMILEERLKGMLVKMQRVGFDREKDNE